MKDNFSLQSKQYAQFRPTYPAELIQYILRLVDNRKACWDCGTGNGQLAVLLADSFDEVYATDISANQLSNAISRPNIDYSRQEAESTYFPDSSFDLITAGQAAHWFNFDAFYAEANRVLKPSGILAIIGYGLLRFNNEVDTVIDYLYHDLLGKYWDIERKFVEHEYKTIPFTFNEIAMVPSFKLEREVTIDKLIGYLKTWSAVQHFKNATKLDPVDQIIEKLNDVWIEETQVGLIPFFARVGRK